MFLTAPKANQISDRPVINDAMPLDLFKAIADLKQEIANLEQQLKEQSEEITLKWDSLLDDLSETELAPRRTDIDVKLVALAWLPSWVIQYHDGQRVRSDTIAAYQLPAVG